MGKNVVLLPQPSTLWAISPLCLFSYDGIVMDTGDFESAVECVNGAGALELRISSALQRWKEWGYIRTVSYRQLLPPDKRKAIAALSKKIVRDLIS